MKIESWQFWKNFCENGGGLKVNNTIAEKNILKHHNILVSVWFAKGKPDLISIEINFVYELATSRLIGRLKTLGS